MTKIITPSAVRLRILMREETALLDLREEAAFATGHPLFAAQLSAGRIEIEAPNRIPRRDCCIVLYDDGEGLTEIAADRLAKLGYSDVRLLDGGLSGWRAAGYELFQDVNSYSKAFGELVEHRRRTPSLPAPDVKALIDSAANVMVLDARRFEEYATMSIPTGISVPGAELVLRAPMVAADPDTMVIVNCAGRTRSIIGAQSLINAGIPNRVFALRNGTIGWTLAKQDLATGQAASAPLADAGALAEARERARAVAYRAGVRRVSAAEAAALDTPDRTLYRFDVRQPDEFEAGHLPGFRNAPGGQLVQETDMMAPVRGARIVLADPLGPRADMTASWLAQMGWEVYVLEGGSEQATELGAALPNVSSVRSEREVTGDWLAAHMHDKVTIIDLASSRQHRTGHVPGAHFALRVDLAAILESNAVSGQVVLTSPDGALAALAAADFPQHPIAVLAGGTEGWKAAGHPLESGIREPFSDQRDIYKRPYEGTDNAEVAMQAYLDWEYGLVEQLERDGTHGFFVI